MICSNCAALSEEGDRFCYNCGKELVDYESTTRTNTTGGFDQDGYPIDDANIPDDDNKLGLSVKANAALAIRDAKRVDISNMRPITRVAYQIESSDKAGSIGTLLSIAFFGICVGLVVTLLALFEQLELFSQTYGSMGAENITNEDRLTEIYKISNTEVGQSLLWLVLGFAALLIGFVVVGKLVLRTKKVRRKKRNREVDEY